MDKTLAFFMNEGTFTWFDHSNGAVENKEEKKKGAPESDDSEGKRLTEQIIPQPFRLESINLCVAKVKLLRRIVSVRSEIKRFVHSGFSYWYMRPSWIRKVCSSSSMPGPDEKNKRTN